MSKRGVASVAAQSSPDTVADGNNVVNNFQIVIATVNGTGSQTANSCLLRALFKMGIPVNGKNVFPSNIQGLPTWFSIRVNNEGYTSRRGVSEILVAMNLATVGEDIENLPSGGVCFYPEEWGIRQERQDIVYYPFPVKSLLAGLDVSPNLKDYVANMIYVGVVAAMLGIDLGEIEGALGVHFWGKASAINLNMSAVRVAFDWAEDNLVKQDVYSVERMDKTSGMILMDGNSAGALGTVFGGVSFVSWYPITPSTSLVDALRGYLAELRTDPASGKATYAVIQAEDELAAAGMIVGAGWAGARAMTSTSGPGLSLMSEFAGFAYFAEIPVVIWDIQRIGPSTGLPTRTSQGDVLKAYFLGHGDTKHVVLLPGNIAECFEFGWLAFDLAERLQTPVFVLSDLDLGMNLWMSEPFVYPSAPMDRGKVLGVAELDRLGEFARYLDVDGDGIGYRTLPGTQHPLAAYFTRGSGHNARAEYSERPGDWADNMARLGRKFETARGLVPGSVVTRGVKPAAAGIVAYGSVDCAVVEACDMLSSRGLDLDYIRIRALPLGKDVDAFLEAHEVVHVVEQNTDGQMARLIMMEFPEYAARVRSVRLGDGLPLTAEWVCDAL